MQFTGKNLELVREALELADAEVHNRIATCPDVVKYADDIKELEEKQAQLRKMMERIDRSMGGLNHENQDR